MAPETPVDQTVAPVEPAAPVQVPPEQDVVSKASGFKAPSPEAKPDEAKFDYSVWQSHLAKLDPQSRKLAEDAYKSMQADYTKKTQEAASKVKEVDSLRQALEQSNRYTPERIQQLLNDPTFVQAAQEHLSRNGGPKPASNGSSAGELSQEEFDYLPAEQQKLYLQQKQTQSMLANLQGELSSMKTQKEDADLSARYKNYDPNRINELYRDLMAGKVQANREHLYRVLNHDENVKNAYEMGRQDERSGVQVRKDASALNGTLSTTSLSEEAPVRQKNEPFQEYWKRIAQSAKAKLGKP